MRFDLELVVASTLTQTGLDTLAKTLYSVDSDIVPMFWDSNASISGISENKGSVNLEKYDNDKQIDDIDISSGVDIKSNSMAYVGNIEHRSAVTPTFNGGIYSSGKSKYLWSKNAIVKPFEYKNKYYSCEVDETIDKSKMAVFTLSFTPPGITRNKKEFAYVDWDEKRYNAYLETSTERVAFDKTIEYIFKKSTADYKFTIKDNIAYLNIRKIVYENEILGISGPQEDNQIFVLPEFPAKDLIINQDPANYTVSGGVIVFKKGTIDEGVNIKASYSVTPVISYIDSNRAKDEDFVFSNINMHPRMVNNKNGTLCLSASFGNTNIPLSLALTASKEEVFGIEPFRVTARLTGVNNIPILNEEVTLKVVGANAIFNESNSSEITKRTISDGTVMADIVAKNERLGYYIQKEWVNAGTITIPYEIKDLNKEEIYLYFVTADDPILGKLNNSEGEEEFTEQYYVDGDISTYSMNGRKIAYVSLQDSNGKLTSRFIKPTGKGYRLSAPSTKRNLSNDTVEDFTADIVTDIIYDSIPEADNIVGYWLITNGVIKVKAEYNGEEISLSSDSVSVSLQNVKSESSFTINRYNSGDGASQLSSFGYYTISEYLKNPYGLNACSIYCIHSDCVQKKCLHLDPTIRNNFILDEGKVGCIHNKAYDAEHTPCQGQDAHLVNPFIMHLEGI